MPKNAQGADDSVESHHTESEERRRVERDRSEVQSFVKQLSGDDIKSGGWFTKLLAHSLRAYSEKVDWQYFQAKYKGVPADAIVDQRIKMASRYAESLAMAFHISVNAMRRRMTALGLPTDLDEPSVLDYADAFPVAPAPDTLSGHFLTEPPSTTFPGVAA